ncbi:hypothetical protein [Actimicrobium sp. CCI2.3]|uniref:hypothetical protein n=1 Tax=Actimicrobium sp. CCI2.3 TaxID=3048616 RepID=UPI002AB46388|nr:hypothetical protein [Actimicrobium sp. CCI2.3]MDY7572991.1 hypothetical protein [Actimicrobium sp. CCI2.3]MEB0023631.1 hypothetical protein [Actimicrobium sp. CCI2.3]
MHPGILTARACRNLALLGLLATGVCTSINAFAQLQIPNPLIRPHGLTNPAAADMTPLPASVPAAGYARTSESAPYPIVPGAPGTTVDNPLTRELNEQKDRFAGFYVSAIVGKQAVLRRSAAQRQLTTGQAMPAVGMSMAPLPLATQAAAMTTRNDALMITDGESFDATGNVGSLFARVSNRQVVIYHVADNSGAELKSGKRFPIVFVGELETSGNPAQPAIVLERPDPLYKRSISVEVKARSASAPLTDNQNQNQNPNQQSLAASPAPLQ